MTVGMERSGRAPLELEVFHDLFVALTEEMGTVLHRTAYSSNIVERRDYSCALYDAAGRTIAMGDHMPVHLGSMPLAVEAVRRRIELHPGDVAVVNDPHEGGTHLPDLTLVQGCWLDSADAEPAYYLANRAHHADVGGASPGSMPMTTDLYEEGIVLPPLRLVAGGRRVERTWRFLLGNVRTSVEREGDLAAQLASLKTGERRLRALVDRYGRERLDTMGNELVEYSDRLVRSLIHDIPDGIYAFEDALDGDGLDDREIPVRVEIRIKGCRASFSFVGTGRAARGPVNANPAIVRSAVFYVLRALLRADAPANDGILASVEVSIPGGSVLDPEWGRPMAAGNVETSQRLVDVLLGALAGAVGDRVPAASQGTMNNVTLGGRHRDGSPFTYYETVAGGSGAHPEGPGWPGIHTHMTNSLNTPIEVLERALPVRVTEYRLRRGSGGDGEYPGGDGVIREIETRVPLDVTLLSERRTRDPYGLAGGERGRRGANWKIGQGGEATTLEAKTTFQMRPGERLRIETPGGGGWGVPSGPTPR